MGSPAEGLLLNGPHHDISVPKRLSQSSSIIDSSNNYKLQHSSVDTFSYRKDFNMWENLRHCLLELKVLLFEVHISGGSCHRADFENLYAEFRKSYQSVLKRMFEYAYYVCANISKFNDLMGYWSTPGNRMSANCKFTPGKLISKQVTHFVKMRVSCLNCSFYTWKIKVPS